MKVTIDQYTTLISTLLKMGGKERIKEYFLDSEPLKEEGAMVVPDNDRNFTLFKHIVDEQDHHIAFINYVSNQVVVDGSQAIVLNSSTRRFPYFDDKISPILDSIIVELNKGLNGRQWTMKLSFAEEDGFYTCMVEGTVASTNINSPATPFNIAVGAMDFLTSVQMAKYNIIRHIKML